MKKLFQNQVVAWVVLILAVALACLWGYNRKDHYEARKTTELLDVKYYQWIADDAKLLSDSTEKTVTQYDTDWNNKYYAVVAVATLNKLSGWTEDDYARALGEKWGLGAGDMLLLLVKGDDWYVALGDNVAAAMTDTQQTKLKQAIDQPYYAGNYDEAVTAFFRQADVFYAQTNLGISGNTSSNTPAEEWTEYNEPKPAGHVSLFKVALLVIGVLVVWAIIDRFRYSRYQRRYRVASPVMPVVPYYPIFWGRPRTVVAPAAPRPPRPVSTSNHSRPSGTYHSTSSRPSSSSRPSGGSRPSSGNSRPGGFGKSGFGGGRR